MLRRKLYETLYGVFGLGALLGGVGLSFISGFVGSLVAGLGIGVLVSLLLAQASRPSLAVTPARDQYDPKFGMKWVHLEVRNQSSGFLGNGEVDNCRATLIFDEGRRLFSPKWASRPNPHRLQYGPGPNGPQWNVVVDEHLYDPAKEQSLIPDKSGAYPELLDVAYKGRLSPNCYISVPEHFKGAGPFVIIEQKPEREFGEGRHPFTLELRNRGQLIFTKRFVLVNAKGTGPEGLTVEDA